MSDRLFNKEQKEAITFGEGPLLIIAGAGTGKTTVITERIKYLILEKKVSPANILALTFTEKASHEMEDRIDKLMPYGYTQMFISTFHSFCDSILRDEAIHIGISPNYKLVTESESVLFLKKHLFELDLNYFRPLGNPTKFLEAILQHFSRLSDEDITPSEYMNYSEEISNIIHSTSSGQESQMSNNDNKEENHLEAKKIVELARAYKSYQEFKVKEGVMDFSDLITQTLNLFRIRKNILEKYRNQFKYILVDEFQDTNFAQNELAILLTGAKKNITVVADDDQAIYRWRGAALSNVIQFKNNFQGAKVITLIRNYRSTQEILDKSYQLIQYNNPNRLEALEKIDKRLISQRKIKGAGIEFIHAQRVDEEAEQIAKKIQGLIKKHPPAGRQGKYKYSDIAILVRANNHAQSIAQALERLKIPYQFLGPGHLFQQEEIKDLIAYLKVLYNLEDSISLFRILQMDVFNLSMRDISTLLTLSRKQNLSLFESMEKADNTYLSLEAKEKIKKIKDMILRHLERVRKDTAGQILYYFLLDTGLFNTFLSVSTEREEQVSQNIAKFFDKIKTFETLNHDANIYAVVDWIDLMMELGESPLVGDYDFRSVNAVNMLTIHSSKGLEFPVVFMVNLVADRFPTRERREKIPLPQNLIKEILPEGDYHIQEERRLFYVGMTRACDLLFFTAAKFYAEGKREKKLSPFIHEVLPEVRDKEEKKKSQSVQLSLVDLTSEYQKSPDEKNIHETLSPFTMSTLSYSALQAFDICPLHFRARYILNLPAPFSAPLSFGISIHATLKDFYNLLRRGTLLSEEELLSLLRKDWISEGYQGKSYEKKMFEKGETILHQYYQNNFDPENIPLAIELPFSFHLDSGLRITGRIDRIDSYGESGIEIIDYKTGASDGISKRDYELQLGLYALAATKVTHEVLYNRKLEEITVTLFYLENGKKISQKITPQDLKDIDIQIQEKVKEIESSDFRCSKSILCHNCEYKMLCSAA